MTTLRKAHVNCPRCKHRFTVRDNGGVETKKADQVWKKFDEAFSAMDKACAKMREIWK